MMQALRSRAATWVVKILFVLLIISFGAWGIADYLRPKGMPTHIATVGGVDVSIAEVSRAVDRERERLRPMFGQVDREQARQLGLVDMALEQIAGRMVVELEGKRLGVAVSDAMVRDAIKANPAFRGPDGQFDRNTFQGLLARIGYDEARLAAEVRADLLQSQLVDAALFGAVAPKTLTQTVARFRGEQRVAQIAFFGVDSAQDVAAPTEEELKAYLAAHADRYATPERRDAVALLLRADDLLSESAPSDADLAKAFDQRRAEFDVAEKRAVAQLVFPDEAAAKAAVEQAAKGATLASLAPAGSTPTDFGPVARGDLPADIAAAAFDAAQPGIYGPVQSVFGWHVVAVSAIEPARPAKLEDVAAELKTALTQDRAADRAFDRSNKIDDALARGAGLEEAAQLSGAKLIALTGVTRAGAGLETVPEAARAKLAEQVYKLALNETSPLIELRGGAPMFLVVKLSKINAAEPQPLDAVRDAVVAAATREKRDAAAKARAVALLDAVKGGKDFADAAKAAGVAAIASKPFTRDGGDVELPPQLVADLFQAKEVGGTSAVRAPNGSGWIAGRLAEIRPLAAEAAPADANSQLDLGVSNDVFLQFVNALKLRYPVRVDHDALRRAF